MQARHEGEMRQQVESKRKAEENKEDERRAKEARHSQSSIGMSSTNGQAMEWDNDIIEPHGFDQTDMSYEETLRAEDGRQVRGAPGGAEEAELLLGRLCGLRRGRAVRSPEHGLQGGALDAGAEGLARQRESGGGQGDAGGERSHAHGGGHDGYPGSRRHCASEGDGGRLERGVLVREGVLTRDAEVCGVRIGECVGVCGGGGGYG